MTWVGIAVKLGEGSNDLCPQRIEMDVADNLQEVGFLLAEDGLISILKELT